jgi:hypothetical protein
VADEDDRAVDLADDRRDVGGVTGQAPVWDRRNDDAEAVGEKLGNEGGEAGRVGEGAVNQDDGGSNFLA